MSLEIVQNQAVATYNENIAYFKANHPDLYNNLALFETALNSGQLKAQFDLQYKTDYFEIIGLEQNIPFYGQNSVQLSAKMVQNGLSMDANQASFKTYYEKQYNDDIVNIALESDMLVPYQLSNAPLVHYTNKHLPQQQIMTEIYKFIIFGVGLGIHIPMIHQQLKSKLYLIVEPSLEIFRLSLFVTNYAALSKEAKLMFAVAQDEFNFRKTFNDFYSDGFVMNHYIKFFKFSDNNDLYIKTIQNVLVSQSHYLYAYDRTFLSLYRTHSYINQGFKTLNVEKIHQLKLFEKPVLYLAAGPSLQRQINFVKNNQDKFIIVAIYATLPKLERHGIKPNIITQYDEQDKQVLNTLEKIEDIEFFKDSIFIFSSHVNAKLMSSFPKENIFIFQAMFELKKEFGMLTSPSIGELTYAILLKLGAKQIYLLGLDLAMDVETNQTHIDGHSGSNVFSQLKDLEDSDDTAYSYRKNTILIKGNFQEEVKSIPVFKTNIDSFNIFTEQFKSKDVNVYNLSNGAYFNNTIPTKSDDIKTSNFETFEDIELKNGIYNALDSISEQGYSKEELEIINLKISGAKKIKKRLEQFHKIKKYSTFEEYKNSLLLMLNSILFEKHNCTDLQSILINFCSHTMHHIFYLFDVKKDIDNKKLIYDINKYINIQLNKIVNTYMVSISYSSDEKSMMSKKLNKFIKEYNIKETIYSVPFFKELVETSLWGRQLNAGKNGIGFFAIEENMNNKDFIIFVKNILKQFPEISLKLYYFFDYQKTVALQMFKQFQNRIELIVPHSIEDIVKDIELWFETTNKTFSLQKVDDIILNNYENIYSVMFKNSSEPINLNGLEYSSLKEQLPHVNSDYYNFANRLKEGIDEHKIQPLYKKGHVGLFAFEENLTKEFVEHLNTIAKNFPELKFTLFYFETSQKVKFEQAFTHLVSRFEFIIPKDIYDVISNIEIWVEAKVKLKSHIFSKIFKCCSKTLHIFPLILNENYELTSNGQNYLESIVTDYNNAKFIKVMSSQLDASKLQNTSTNDSIGFFATKESLQNKDFMKFLEILFEMNLEVKFKAFYLNDTQKNMAEDFLSDYLDQIEFIIPQNIYGIVQYCSIYIHSSLVQTSNSINYNKIWHTLNETKSNLFKINLFKSIIDEDYIESIQLVDDSRTKLNNSVISKIFKDDQKYEEYLFVNSMNQPFNNALKDVYSKNCVGFLASADNMNNKEFTDYLETFINRYPEFEYNAFYFDTKEHLCNCNLQNSISKINLIKVTTGEDILNHVELFIHPRRVKVEANIRLSKYILENSQNIIDFNYIKNVKNHNIQNITSNKNHELIINYEKYGLSENDLKEANYNHLILLFNYAYKLENKNKKLDLNKSLHDLVSFELRYYTLKYPEVKTIVSKTLKRIHGNK